MMNEEQIIDVINKLELGPKLDPKNTSYDATLKSLGIDSLNVFAIFVELELQTGKIVPDSDVEKLTTIRELAKYFS
jgi:acyl carrier protein